MEKRGQITLFIVIGILLIIAVVLIIVYEEQITLSQILPDTLFPQKTGTIENFVESCADNVVRDGMALLGAQGGYIWLPATIENNPLSYVDTGLKVPYWHYHTESRIPTLEIMEAHLSRYVNENLRGCLDNFAAFKDQYDIVEKGDVITETSINDDVVLFSIMYPFDVIDKDGKKVTELEKFHVESDVKLKRVFEVAEAIMQREAVDMKFEKITVDLLALDPDIPLTGIDFTCSRKRWAVSDVENKINALLRKNIPSIRVDHTSYEPVPEQQPYVLNHYVWRATELTYDDVRAGFTLVEPFRMNVRPRHGNTLRSGMLRGDDLASFLCMQRWNFVYDLNYPVIVSVEDIEHNFVLNFGFAVNVKDNMGSREPMLSRASALDFVETSEEAYCTKINDDFAMKVRTYSNVSDPLYGDYSDFLPQVNVSFTCIRYTCAMGKTGYPAGRVKAEAVLETQFPYCANGIMRAAKPGYKTAVQFVTTSPGRVVDMYLTPVKTMSKYSVVKHAVSNGAVTGARRLDSDETAFITLRYVDNQTMVHETSGSYPIASDFVAQPLELLGEADFPYRVEVYLMDENAIVGGYTGTWTPKWSELKFAEAIEFHVVEGDFEGLGDEFAPVMR